MRLKGLSHREDVHLYLETLEELFELDPARQDAVQETAPQPALKLLKK